MDKKIKDMIDSSIFKFIPNGKITIEDNKRYAQTVNFSGISGFPIPLSDDEEVKSITGGYVIVKNNSIRDNIDKQLEEFIDNHNV